MPPRLPSADLHLIQITDAAFADAARRSGEWLVCRPGCMQCCVGVFSISQLDALRLRHGLAGLAETDPQRAQRVRERVSASVARLAPEFPGDLESGVLDESEAGEARFAQFGNDEACPVLDPLTGTCDLYAARPMTCRIFGPPVRSHDDHTLGCCELCYHGASEREIAACEMQVDADDLESPLIAEAERATGTSGMTVVALALRD